jgi:hypothetical protein
MFSDADAMVDIWEPPLMITTAVPGLFRADFPNEFDERGRDAVPEAAGGDDECLVGARRESEIGNRKSEIGNRKSEIGEPGNRELEQSRESLGKTVLT